MSLLKKALGVLSSAVITVSAASGIVSAEEKYPVGSSLEPERVVYSLDQLFEMSDEEFMELTCFNKNPYEISHTSSAEECYFRVKQNVTQEQEEAEKGISGLIVRSIKKTQSWYTEGDTEKEIKELLGSKVKYTFDSKPDDENFAGHVELSVYFPDYDLDASKNDITEKQITEFARCYYCIDQVLPVLYMDYGSYIYKSKTSKNTSPTEDNTKETLPWTTLDWGKVTVKGDADLNGVTDLADVTIVAKYILSHSSYPITSEVAYVNADMNQDGDINGIDLSVLIEINLGKKTS